MRTKDSMFLTINILLTIKKKLVTYYRDEF